MGLAVDPSQRGSALLFLFIAMALIGALSFMFLHGSRNSVSLLQAEQSDATATATQDCTNIVNMAVKRLELRGCGSKISYLSDGSNANTGAPTDGSCSIFHPKGGGAKACNASALAPGFDLTTLLPGESGGGVIYVGVAANGKRIYTTPTNQSNAAKWSAGASINVAGLTNTLGKENTDILTSLSNADAPYEAANICRAVGPEWYLPSTNELYLILQNYNLGDLNGNIPYDWFWASNSQNFLQGWKMRYHVTFGASQFTETKNVNAMVRCVRSD